MSRMGDRYNFSEPMFICVAKTEHSHPLERFNPFTIEP